MRQVTVMPSAEQFPVHNVFVIGRNYIADPAERDRLAAGDPVVTMKPTATVIGEGERIRLPAFSSQVNFEIEVLVLIGRGGRDIPEAQALSHVRGYGVGLDLTAFDLQQQARAEGLPWTVCKGFHTAAPLSHFIEAGAVADPESATFIVEVNGEIRQRGSAADMVFGIARIVSYLSRVVPLTPADVVFTGTPTGAGPLASGDRLRLEYAEGLVEATFEVA